MADIKKIPLVASEIAGLWGAYMSETLTKCVLTYFLNRVEDEETSKLMQEVLDKAIQHIPIITDFFNEAGLPIPDGFTNEDVNVNAPRLFTDAFYPAYLSLMARVSMHNYTLALNQIARLDLIDYFSNRITDAMELYKKTTNLRLSKGIFIRAPRVEVPKKVQYVEGNDFMVDFFGEKRPMILREVTQLFSMTFSNIVGRAIVTGFGQVSKDKEASNYYFEGKDITLDIIEELTSIYIKEDIPIPSSSDSYVTDSIDSPFSEKLMMAHTIALGSIGVSNIGIALGITVRADLQAIFMKHLTKSMKYTHKGGKIAIKNKWMEQPPQVVKHENLVKI